MRRSIRQLVPPSFHILQLEVATVTIVFEGLGLTLSVAAYSPPKLLLPIDDLQTLFGIEVPVIVAGDLNSKLSCWYSLVFNPNGRRLERLLSTCSTMSLPLDHFYISGGISFRRSGHRPVEGDFPAVQHLDHLGTLFRSATSGAANR